MTQPAAPAQPPPTSVNVPAVPPAQPPAPPAVPYLAPPALPAPTPPPAPAAPAAGTRPSDPATGDDLPYYQEGVAWRNLPPEQQLAYWMHRSRKHEERVNAMRDYDELKGVSAKYTELLTQSQTEHERAIAEARRQGETTAMGRANVMLVEAYVRSAAAARGVDEEAVSDFLETTNLGAFVNAATGQVDTAKVYRQVNRMSPVPATAVAPAGVPVAPVVPAPPTQPGWPQQIPAPVPGQPVPQPGQWYGQQPVPAAPQWPGQQVPGAPVAPGQPAAPALPDFGQGVFNQAPPSGLDAGRAAARARYGDKTTSTS